MKTNSHWVKLFWVLLLWDFVVESGADLVEMRKQARSSPVFGCGCGWYFEVRRRSELILAFEGGFRFKSGVRGSLCGWGSTR